MVSFNEFPAYDELNNEDEMIVLFIYDQNYLSFIELILAAPQSLHIQTKNNVFLANLQKSYELILTQYLSYKTTMKYPSKQVCQAQFRNIHPFDIAHQVKSKIKFVLIRNPNVFIINSNITRMGLNQSRQIKISSACREQVEVVGSTKRLAITSKNVKNQRLTDIQSKLAKNEQAQGSRQKLVKERDLILKYHNDTVQTITYETQNINWTERFHHKDCRTLKLAKGMTFFSAFLLREGVRKQIFSNKPITEIKEYGYIFYQFQDKLRYGLLQKGHNFRVAKGSATIGMGNYPPGFKCECGQRFKCLKTCRFYDKYTGQKQGTLIITSDLPKPTGQ